MDATKGQRITTRHFGGYESVKVLQVHETYYVVSRFGGQTAAVLPKDRIAKIFDDANNELWCSDTEQGLHPALP